MLDAGDGCDGVPHGSHPLEEGVLHLVCGDDRPAGPVIQHLFVGLLRAGRGLEWNLIILSFLMTRQIEFH